MRKINEMIFLGILFLVILLSFVLYLYSWQPSKKWWQDDLKPGADLPLDATAFSRYSTTQYVLKRDKEHIYLYFKDEHIVTIDYTDIKNRNIVIGDLFTKYGKPMAYIHQFGYKIFFWEHLAVAVEFGPLSPWSKVIWLSEGHTYRQEKFAPNTKWVGFKN